MIGVLKDIISLVDAGSIDISSFTNKELKEIGEYCIEVCSEKLPHSNSKKSLPTLSIRKRHHKTSRTFGWYEHEYNKITIFYYTCGDLRNFVKTIVHEYTHFLQPGGDKYYKLLDKYGYDDHPYEVEAFSNESKYGNRVLKKVVKEFSL